MHYCFIMGWLISIKKYAQVFEGKYKARSKNMIIKIWKI